MLLLITATAPCFLKPVERKTKRAEDRSLGARVDGIDWQGSNFFVQKHIG
jgi:hypothetical protein